MAVADGSGERQRSCAAVFALILAAALYLMSGLMISDLGGSDGVGNSVTSLFATLLAFLLWLPLGAFVALSCAQGRMPGRGVAAVTVLLVLAPFAAAFATAQMSRPSWLAVTPLLLPPLAVGFALWAKGYAGFAATVRKGAGSAFALAALALMMPPVIHEIRMAPIRARAEAEAERQFAEEQRRAAAAAQAREARFRSLGPHSRLDDYLPYLGLHEERGAAAVAGARRLPTRQADAERLIQGQPSLEQLVRMHELDLDASPALCEAYRARMNASLAELVPQNDDWPSVLAMFRDQLPNLGWLTGDGCDLQPQIIRLRERTDVLTRQSPWSDLTGPLDELLRRSPPG
jgi:hypothetical protein